LTHFTLGVRGFYAAEPLVYRVAVEHARDINGDGSAHFVA
jgi:hypothetical protein